MESGESQVFCICKKKIQFEHHHLELWQTLSSELVHRHINR